MFDLHFPLGIVALPCDCLKDEGSAARLTIGEVRFHLQRDGAVVRIRADGLCAHLDPAGGFGRDGHFPLRATLHLHFLLTAINGHLSFSFYLGLKLDFTADVHLRIALEEGVLFIRIALIIMIGIIQLYLRILRLQ